jgi:hypothetical protein
MTDANENAASPCVALTLCLGPHLHIHLRFVRPQSELEPPQNSRNRGWLSLAAEGLRSSAILVQ